MAERSAVSTIHLSGTAINTAPLGLLGLGLTALLFGLHYTRLIAVDARILGACMFYGGAGQILVGLMEWRRRHPFCAITCTAYGLFWISLIALIILPESSSGAAPQAAALVSYLVMWGLFTLILLFGSEQVQTVQKAVLAGLAGMILTLAAGIAFELPFFETVAGFFGMGSGLLALYGSMAHPLTKLLGKRS